MCLLAAAASVFALNAQAADWSNEFFRPYIGADYVYSDAKHGGMAKHAKKDYNSWMINFGTDIAKYTSVEAFFQQAPERKAKYKRLLNTKISGEAIERLTEEGFRGPVRKRQRPQLDEAYDSRKYQHSPYQNYFRERFVEGLSIRRSADAH